MESAAIRIVLLCQILIVPTIFSTEYPCTQDITPTKNFQPNEYFKGIWYLTSAEHTYSSDRSDLCEESSMEVLQCGDVIRQNTSEYIGYVKRFLHSEILIFLSDFDDGLGEYTSVHKYLNKYTPTYQQLQLIPTTIIATDYDNYSVIYTCQDVSGQQNGNFLVLKRSMYDESKDDEINKKLSAYGMDYSKFISRNHVNCPKDPDF
ncbi:hypothetical protein O3M35_012351 [Rhynocoris fuscipes]|uniref:Uncharacterized protein n=1 Tax=Rhynocoris fuscipes TaxID=488301 RepID=A0AAW1CV93_9HEMI